MRSCFTLTFGCCLVTLPTPGQTDVIQITWKIVRYELAVVRMQLEGLEGPLTPELWDDGDAVGETQLHC